MSNKYATLFGGGYNNTETKEYKETILIGELLAQNDYIVKNGGYRGLMEAVSKGATSKDGVAYGFTCSTFPSTKGNEFLTKTIVCDDLYDRLRCLIRGTDLFIVQRGSIGTLAELFLCMDIIRKMDKDDRPEIILIGNFWGAIFKPFSEILFSSDEMDLIRIVDDVEDIELFI